MFESIPIIDSTTASVILFGLIIYIVAFNCIDEVEHIWKVKKLIK
jgi:hypothetical protein